jgi:hypothetical protein
MEASLAFAAPADATAATPTTSVVPTRLIAGVKDVIKQISDSIAEMKANEAAANKEIEDAEEKATTAVKEAPDDKRDSVEKELFRQLVADVKAINAKSKAAIAALKKKAETLALLECCAKLGVTMKTATEPQKTQIGAMKVHLVKLANQDADLLTIPELCEITLFFCGEKALAEFKAKLNQWAFDAERISVMHGDKEFTVYLTAENPNHTVLPSSHPDCTNRRAMVVHIRMGIRGNMTFVKVFQQDHARRQEDLREKSRLELQELRSTGAVKTGGNVVFTEEEREELQRLSEALAAETLPMPMGTPVRLQWKMSHRPNSTIPKNHRAYFQTLAASALIFSAKEMQKSSKLEVAQEGKDLELEVKSLKGDPTAYMILKKQVSNYTEEGVEVPEILKQKLLIAQPKIVPVSMLLKYLSGSVSPEISALMCEAMAVMADMFIAERLAAEQAAEKLAAEKRTAKLVAAKLAAEQAVAKQRSEE